MAQAKTDGFSADEKAAIRQAAAEARRKMSPEELTTDMLAKIDEMPAGDREVALRIHGIVAEVAPQLSGKTFYGMPAWADDKGKVVLFFQNKAKFKVRYHTLGFQDTAHLDDGTMWPISYAIPGDLTTADEKRIADLVRTAVG